MAVPKKRRSKAKKRTRRSCWSITAPNLQPCPNCGQAIPSHTACPECGQYKGRQAIEVKVKATQQEA